MKKLIHKIKMWWWKRTNPQKYYEELYGECFKRLGDGLERLKISMTEFSKAVYKYGECDKK